MICFIMYVGKIFVPVFLIHPEVDRFEQKNSWLVNKILVKKIDLVSWIGRTDGRK